MRKIVYKYFLAVSIIAVSCKNKTVNAPVAQQQNFDRSGLLIPKDTSSYEPNNEWEKYWYAGKAEITSYILKQSRYGEIHEGTLVNVFVTEDFSKSKQVKLDEPEDAGDDRVKILKLNQSLKFVTGIYPYSLMLSTFSPVDIHRYPHPVKITASAQEWCGMSFFQLNNRNNKFLLGQRSYFEKENDEDKLMDPVFLEDELWSLLRIDPTKLPTGEQQMLPGALYLRLSHKPLEQVPVQLTSRNQDSSLVYTASFPSLNRVLSITIENKFPYSIMGWSDSFPGIDGKTLSTSAIRNKVLITDYWNKHANADRQLREELGLMKDRQ